MNMKNEELVQLHLSETFHAFLTTCSSPIRQKLNCLTGDSSSFDISFQVAPFAVLFPCFSSACHDMEVDPLPAPILFSSNSLSA